MMMKRFLLIIATLFLLASCAENINPDTVSVGDTGKSGSVTPATVISVNPIKVKGSKTVGQTAGAIAGAVGGSAIGSTTRINILTGLAGGLLGGFIGGAAEEAITAQEGYEYIIETANGNMITVIQGKEPAFQKGDRVLLMGGSKARIVADNR